MTTRRHQQLVIVSDLDGTLLDHETYAVSAAARRVLGQLAEIGVPVVACTSKTDAEVVRWAGTLPVGGLRIVENGGAICGVPVTDDDPVTLPGTSQTRRLVLGAQRETIVPLLRNAAETAGLPVKLLSDMDLDALARYCGFSRASAVHASQREFDEPFVVPDGTARAFVRFGRLVRAEGISLSKGGRFYHALGGTDKGRATRMLRAWFRQHGPVCLVGCGDAANDIPLLRAVDVPVIIRRANDSETRRLAARVPSARITTAIGPDGWAEAVSAILREWHH